jgi:hypothetical protein
MWHAVRSEGKVGKIFGNVIYIHKSAINCLPTRERELVEVTSKVTSLNYDIVKVDLNNSAVSFIVSPDWDSAREPRVGDVCRVQLLGGKSSYRADFYLGRETNPQIYHHKWMFVDDDYEGFDVEEAKRWSERWENSGLVLPEDKSRIGYQDYWEDLIKDLQ